MDTEKTKILVEFPDHINLLIVEKQLEVKRQTGKKIKKPIAVVALIDAFIEELKTKREQD